MKKKLFIGMYLIYYILKGLKMELMGIRKNPKIRRISSQSVF